MTPNNVKELIIVIVSWYAENTDYWDSTVEVYAVYEGSYNVQKSRTNKYNLAIID